MTGSVDLGLVPRLRPGVRLRYDGRTGGYLLLSPERGLLLNESAAAIARRCDGTRRVNDVVLELVRNGVPECRAQQDVCDLLSELSERGLVALQAAP
jgi:pyrroloquinoline quinone biosynthesis protein D